MHDTRRHVQGGSAVDSLAASFNVSQAQAEAVMRAVAPELAWALETRSLCRGGLADLVEAVGRIDRAPYLNGSDVFLDVAARAEGDKLVTLLLGDSKSALATKVARHTRLGEPLVASMLPGLAVLTVAALAGRARSTLGALLLRMPPLGHWSKGSPHADLADILRRGCGGGPYASGQLRRVVRARLGRAGGFGGLGLIGWYLRFTLLRPLQTVTRPIVGRVLPQR
jgi:hypothetical protein